MNVLEYQNKAHAFAAYGDNAMYPVLGLAEEAGEVCGKIAKFIRKNTGFQPANMYRDDYPSIMDWNAKNEQFRKDLSKELGDAMWMIAELCTVYGLDLGEVMAENIEKLTDRKAKGLIVGEGDTNEERIANTRMGR